MRFAALLCLAPLALPAAALPPDLAATGLDAAQAMPFTPQYPLWTDGAAKRRWLSLPPGASIDASRPEAWQFPAGTRAWKEFSYGERRVETRYLERMADGAWRFAAYVWNEEGTEAVLAPAEGAVLAVPQAPGGRYAVPSRADCLACHEGSATPVLGFSALQLARELPRLSSLKILRNLPAEAPRIAAPSAEARAALGYLHGNCGHCHNDAGPLANVGLVLAQPAGGARPADPRLLLSRLRHPNPLLRMPPLGVTLPDADGITLVERLAHSLSSQPEPSP